MTLQVYTLALGNFRDDTSGNNYAANTPVYILNSGGTLADIFRDQAGAQPIAQDGLNNISDAYGEFTFYVNSGQYISRVAGRDRLINVVGSDYFDSRVDDAVEQITQQTLASRGFRVVGTFADGFTYELFNDVGIDANGNSWIYTGAGAPNKVVAAGTVPSVGAGYEQVTFNAAENVQMTSGESVQKFTAQSRQAIEALYKSQGYNNVFFFEDGFTYTETNDVGIYEDGSAWTYADSGALPVTIAAGTVPSEGSFIRVNFTSNYVRFVGKAQNLLGGNVVLMDGQKVTTGQIVWVISTRESAFPISGTLFFAHPLNGLWSGDFISDDEDADCYNELQDILSKDLKVNLSPRVHVISLGLVATNSVQGGGSATIDISTSSDGGELYRAIAVRDSNSHDRIDISGINFKGGYERPIFEDDVDTTTGEQSHFVSVESSSNVYIHDNTGFGPKGDSVYVGTSPLSSEGTISKNIHVYNNHFDNARRCAVAAVYFDGLYVYDNQLLDNNKYVAAIDIEPNKIQNSASKNFYLYGKNFIRSSNYGVNLIDPVARTNSNINIGGQGARTKISARFGVRAILSSFGVGFFEAAVSNLEFVDFERYESGNLKSIAGRFIIANSFTGDFTLENCIDRGTDAGGWSLSSVDTIDSIKGNIVRRPSGQIALINNLNGVIEGNDFTLNGSSLGLLKISNSSVDIKRNKVKGSRGLLFESECSGTVEDNAFSCDTYALATTVDNFDVLVGENSNSVSTVINANTDKMTQIDITGLGTRFKEEYGTSFVTGRDYARGSIRWEQFPVAGSYVGEVVVSSGVFGVDAVTKKFGLIEV